MPQRGIKRCGRGGGGKLSGTGYALGVNCGITFAGLKPASLFWLKEEQCGELDYYRKSFAKRKFRFMVVKSAEGRRLFYVFNQNKLEELLFDKQNRTFLHSCGYRYDGIGGALIELKRRLQGDCDFPHEVGLFLGYPLEDVRGFMADARRGVCTECGYWKVYGHLNEKKKIFERYRKCSRCICDKMSSGMSIEEIFKLDDN